MPVKPGRKTLSVVVITTRSGQEPTLIRVTDKQLDRIRTRLEKLYDRGFITNYTCEPVASLNAKEMNAHITYLRDNA
jgi:hypothetical protein